MGPPRAYADSIGSLTAMESEVLGMLRPERTVKHKVPSLTKGYLDVESEMHSNSVLSAPAQRLYRLSNARVLGAAYGHGVITNADRFILGQHESWRQPIDCHSIHYAVKLPRCSRLQGTSLSLISNWSDNYWHWMFDVLGKLVLLRDGFPDYMSDVERHLVLNLHQFPFKLQSLLRLGYAKDKLVDVAAESHFLCDTLLIADRPHRDPMPEMDLIESLRRAFLPADRAAAKPRNIYISRSFSATRRIANEAELILRLEKFGFEVVHLEKLSFDEQVHLFQSAAMVLAQHGAGLSNLVFCSPGTKVVELFEPEFVNPCFAFLSAKMSLNYRMLLNGEAKGLRKGEWINIPAEVKVNIDDIIQMLAPELGA
jgi:hypothetical protein